MKIRNYFYISVLWLLTACAIQSIPSGGPEDNTPPRVIEEFPENEKKWFTGKEISIEMDEFVSLKNPAQEIIISPPMDQELTIKLKGKKVIIKLNSELQDSTTYTVQFGNAIADITKGNILKDYQYVFSTGGEIDSLVLSGKVFDAFTLKEVDDINVLLYEESCDTGIFKHKARYFARSNKNGDYKFQNLKAGNYLLFAVDDKNRNYYYNQGEQVAFYKDPIRLKSDSFGFSLMLFNNQEEKYRLLGSQGIRPGKSIFIYNKAISQAKISLLNPMQQDSLFYRYSITRDSLIAWIPNYNNDTSVFFIDVEPGQTDTVSVKYANKKESQLPVIEIDKRNNYYGLSRSFSILSSEPITELDTTGIIVYEDTNKIINRFRFSRNSVNPLLLDIKSDFLPGKSYRFFINKNVLTGISGRKNDSIMISFLMKANKDLGSIAIKINSDSIDGKGRIIIELLNSKNKAVRRKISDAGKEENVIFNELLPGKYNFRFVLDENNNGIWDSGNIELRRLPERIHYLSKPIELKANWEILDLKFDFSEN